MLLKRSRNTVQKSDLISHDEEAYEEFSEVIEESYEVLLDFQAYAEEAQRSGDPVYREKAVLKAFSATEELKKYNDNWDELFDALPVEGVNSVEDIVLKTELYSDRLQMFDLDLEGEPDEIEMAAINAVKDNYGILTEYDILIHWNELDTEFGNIDIRIEV
mgnify:CR=1 FL=1